MGFRCDKAIGGNVMTTIYLDFRVARLDEYQIRRCRHGNALVLGFLALVAVALPLCAPVIAFTA